jgi:hypothetical protein
MAPQRAGEIRGQQIAEHRMPMVIEVPPVAGEHLELGAARCDLRAVVAEEVQTARRADLAEVVAARLAGVEAQMSCRPGLAAAQDDLGDRDGARP